MKHKTSELTGALLDAAVAKAEGFLIGPLYEVRHEGAAPTMRRLQFSPSTDWSVGGPIIEREHISLNLSRYGWGATHDSIGTIFGATTPLVAAMRAYVAKKLGEEVDLPIA